VPGPACYARGGTEPTLTDANLLLGYLDADSFLGGRMKLDREAAVRAVASRIGSSLGAEPTRAAWGIHEVINEDVAKAFRVHASERGVDYRRCSMVVFGGSGPVHGCRIARKLRVPQVICPAGAGVMSAFGLLSSPVGFELVQSLRVSLADLDVDRFTRLVSDLQSRVRAQLVQTGAGLDDARFELRLDMRYIGQGYEVEVFVREDDLKIAFAGLAAGFAQAYRTVFGQSFDDKEIEIVAWKVEMHGPVPGAAQPYDLRDDGRRGAVALRGERPAYFGDDGGFVQTRVFDRFGLRPGDMVEGPALIEEPESTCVLAPGDRARVDSRYNLVIDIGSTS
jgi:N-methylhydantoinase A